MEIAEIITHRDLRVPWVARWTSEVRGYGYLATPTGVRYRDETPDDRDLGVLWQREGDSRGLGEPQWAQMHTGRQHMAMVGPCCQVCGRVIEGKLTWLLPIWESKPRRGRLNTTTPPTCETCIPVARSLCPHLNAKGAVAFDVSGYRPWGVFGEVYTGVGQHGKVLGDVQFAQPDRLPWVLAKQLIVEIYDFRKRRD